MRDEDKASMVGDPMKRKNSQVGTSRGGGRGGRPSLLDMWQEKFPCIKKGGKKRDS